MTDKELYFESRFSEEEIDKNFKDIDLFSNIMDGLNEAVEYAKGNIAPEMVVHKRSIPDINVAAESPED